jgi:hypothetical protein
MPAWLAGVAPWEDMCREAELAACRCESLLNLAVYMQLPIQWTQRSKVISRAHAHPAQAVSLRNLERGTAARRRWPCACLFREL